MTENIDDKIFDFVNDFKDYSEEYKIISKKNNQSYIVNEIYVKFEGEDAKSAPGMLYPQGFYQALPKNFESVLVFKGSEIKTTHKGQYQREINAIALIPETKVETHAKGWKKYLPAWMYINN